MKDILKEITRLRLERNWTEYELAKKSGLAQSTISSWYRKKQTPSIQTLDKICKGFGITLSQFFGEGDDAIFLTPEQRRRVDLLYEAFFSCTVSCMMSDPSLALPSAL